MARLASVSCIFALLAVAPVSGVAQKPVDPAKPPKGAVILFDGKDASQWIHRGTKEPCKWDVVDGALVVKAGARDIVTKQEFGDYQLHIEFWLPLLADQTSQNRANSGVYNHARYEIQVLDSYNNPTYPFGGCGAIYEQKDPDKNAIRPPEQWNTYDITFRAPRFEKDGTTLKEKPRITVIHNGIKIHDDVEIDKPSTRSGEDGPRPKVGPILLQNHGAQVRFRNIWLLPLKLK